MENIEKFVSLQEVWNKILANIDSESDTLSNQLEKAKDRFPDLVSGFNLLAAYIGFLHNQQNIIEITPWPLEPPVKPYPFPKNFCERGPQMCDCANGSMAACREIGKSHVDKITPVVMPTSCEELWKAYFAARNQEREIYEQAVSEGRLSEISTNILRVQKKSQIIWQRLINQRCVSVGTNPH